MRFARRPFLTGLLAAGSLSAIKTRAHNSMTSSENAFTRPAALRPGDTVGLITPATEVIDPDRLALAARTLKYFDLRMKLGAHVGVRASNYKQSIDARLDDLHAMFRDPEVRAVFCVRGGYGAMHLLDRIDYDLIRRHPKIFLGYSDITALHLAINKNARLLTFHGPVAISSFSEYTRGNFRRALFETKPLGVLANPPESDGLRPAHNLRTIVAGRASGSLIGGNLTLICATLGTPYEIETRGRILFLEDVDEEPYSIDRMLTQLRLAGKFDGVAGVVFGECEHCRPRDFQPASASPYSLGETINNILGALRVPVFYGLTFGHTDDQLTLPIGGMATLDAAAGTITITESCVG